MSLGIVVTTRLSFVAGPLSAAQCSIAASSSSLTADGTTTTTLTVLARVAYNNPVVTPVSMAGSGGNNSFGTASGSTDTTGQFVTTLASTQVQSETITASLGGAINPNLVIQFLAGPATSAQSSLVVSPSTQTADRQHEPHYGDADPQRRPIAPYLRGDAGVCGRG